MVHRDFHTGNILLLLYGNCYPFSGNLISGTYISDMGLCGKVSNIDKTKFYGVMPFVAPEVLKGKPYSQAADIYSFWYDYVFCSNYKTTFCQLCS
jgi:serine/threonine protein kinase